MKQDINKKYNKYNKYLVLYIFNPVILRVMRNLNKKQQGATMKTLNEIIEEAINNSENKNEDGSINWSFVDADLWLHEDADNYSGQAKLIALESYGDFIENDKVTITPVSGCSVGMKNLLSGLEDTLNGKEGK